MEGRLATALADVVPWFRRSAGQHMAGSRTAKVIAVSLGVGLTQLVGIVSMAVMARVLSQHDYVTYCRAFFALLCRVPLGVSVTRPGPWHSDLRHAL